MAFAGRPFDLYDFAWTGAKNKSYAMHFAAAIDRIGLLFPSEAQAKRLMGKAHFFARNNANVLLHGSGHSVHFSTQRLDLVAFKTCILWHI